MRLPILLAFIVTVPAAAQTLPKRQLVEELRLDANTEDFPDIGNVLVNARGDIAVFVNKDQQLRFYDAKGVKLGTFGRVGSGPSEFRRANMHGWAGDTLWVYDVDLRRITFISPARQLLRSEVLNQSLNSMGGYAPGTTPPPTRPAPPTALYRARGRRRPICRLGAGREGKASRRASGFEIHHRGHPAGDCAGARKRPGRTRSRGYGGGQGVFVGGRVTLERRGDDAVVAERW
jgi:hypothetical protein